MCPICKKTKRLIKYHIQYDPEKIIYACQNCNYIEYNLRRGKIKRAYKKQVLSVYNFQKRFSNLNYPDLLF